MTKFNYNKTNFLGLINQNYYYYFIKNFFTIPNVFLFPIFAKIYSQFYFPKFEYSKIN